MLTQELLDAYLVTDYRVEYPAGAFILRIGQQSPQLQRLLREKGQGSATFVTAWNPRSQPASVAANIAAQQHLLSELHNRGCITVPGIGIDPAGQWQGEESVLALGLSRVASIELGRKYAQNAVVWAGEDAIPQLLLCY